MNVTQRKYNLLVDYMRSCNHFTPAYQYTLISGEKYPESFDDEVNYIGDWSGECLPRFDEITALVIKPRYLFSVGRLVPRQIHSCEESLLAMLNENNIPYMYKSGNVILSIGVRGNG